MSTVGEVWWRHATSTVGLVQRESRPVILRRERSEPRRMATSTAQNTILRGTQERAPQDDGEAVTRG